MSEPAEWTAGPRAAWIVVDTDGGAFVCRRCETREVFRLPTSLMTFTERAQRFVKAHLGCKGDVAHPAQSSLL
jgi:hypothetical protein